MSLGRNTQDILHYGKRYKGPFNQSDEDRLKYLRMAAKLYATAPDIHKRRTLMWWWIEGVRDYCADQQEVEEMRDILRNEAAKHITEGRY